MNDNNNQGLIDLATKLVSEIGDQLNQQDTINKILPTSVIERYTKILNEHIKTLEGINLQTAAAELKVLKENFEEHLQNNEKLQNNNNNNNNNNNEDFKNLATKLVSEISDQLSQQDAINKILPTSVIERYTKIMNDHVESLEGANLQTATTELKVLKEDFEEHLQNNEKLQDIKDRINEQLGGAIEKTEK
jgi:vacuolar-type H+-ATPase catalytic subunit A/Vma1